jgi:predicted nucleotidyltransferase
MMGGMRADIPGLEEFITYLRSQGIRTCILYGSAAAEGLRADSDIDIAVAATVPLSAFELKDHYLKAVNFLGREVDLRDLRRARGLYLKEIMTKGEILLNEDPEFLGSKAIEMMDYQSSLAPGINAMLKRRLERTLDGK